MGYTLEEFSAACHTILTEDPGPKGRTKVCALVRDVLKDQTFVATHWDEQSFPFGAPQDERLREADVFVREVKRVSPRTRVILPRHFERHTLPPKRRRA